MSHHYGMETTHTTPPRLTTREVSRRLKCSDSAAVQILKAAKAKFEKSGNAYLWLAEDVERIIHGIKPTEDAT